MRRSQAVAAAVAGLVAAGSVVVQPQPARADGTVGPTFTVGSIGGGGGPSYAVGPLGPVFASESGSSFSLLGGGPSPSSDGTVTVSGANGGVLVPPGVTTPLLLAVAVPGSPDLVSIYSQLVDGSFASATNVASIGTGLSRIGEGDITGDGDPDLVVESVVSSTVVLRTVSHPDSSAPVVSAPITVPDLTSALDLTVADATGDGRPDVLLTGRNAGGNNELVVIHNVGGALTAAGADVGTPAGSFSDGIGVGDLNGDSRPDVAFNGSAGLSVRFGQAGGSLGPARPLALPPGADFAGLAVGDLNGDGIADLAIVNLKSPVEIDVALGAPAGPGAFTTVPGSLVSSGGSGPLLIADLYGDGRNDVYAPGLDELLHNVSPAGAAGPGSLALGSQRVSTVGALTAVTFTNNGQGPLNDGSVAMTGPNAGDFLIAQDGCTDVTVPIGGSCTVSLRYAPSVEAAETATLQLTSPDLPGTAGAVALSGTGTPAPQIGPGPAGPAGPVGAQGPTGAPAEVIPYLAVNQPTKTAVGGTVKAYVASSANGSLTVQTLRGRTLVGTHSVPLHAGIHIMSLTVAPKTAGSYTLKLTTVVRGAAATSVTTSLAVIPKPKPKPKSKSR